MEPGHPHLSIARPCELLGLARSSYYYEPVPESAENLRLMGLIDAQYTRVPTYGGPRMTAWRNRLDLGFAVNPKRVPRLMRGMGIEAIYPKPRRSPTGAGHRVYPYWLRGVSVTQPNHVWCTDISVPQKAI